MYVIKNVMGYEKPFGMRITKGIFVSKGDQ